MAHILIAPAYRARAAGLSSVIDWVSDTDPHWQQGGTIVDDLAGSAIGVIGPLGCGEDAVQGLPKTFGEGARQEEAAPFALYGSVRCGPVGMSETMAAMAAARLSAGVDRGLYLALDSTWAVPRLAQVPAVTPAPADAPAALAAAEAAFWEGYPGAGVLIMDPAYLGALDEWLTSAGGQLMTRTGHRVALVPGLGARLYLVPPITGYRSEVVTSSATGTVLDTAHNDMYAIAEQIYLLVSDFTAGSAAMWE